MGRQGGSEVWHPGHQHERGRRYILPTAESVRASPSPALCQYYKEVSDAGIVLVSASANDNLNFFGYVPASCPDAVAVTAMDVSTNDPAGFSNWLPSVQSAVEAAGNGRRSAGPNPQHHDLRTRRGRLYDVIRDEHGGAACNRCGG